MLEKSGVEVLDKDRFYQIYKIALVHLGVSSANYCPSPLRYSTIEPLSAAICVHTLASDRTKMAIWASWTCLKDSQDLVKNSSSP